MPDDADQIEKCELEIWDIIYRMHKAGIRYEIIYNMVVEIKKTLEMQSYANNWLNQYSRSQE